MIIIQFFLEQKKLSLLLRVLSLHISRSSAFHKRNAIISPFFHNVFSFSHFKPPMVLFIVQRVLGLAAFIAPTCVNWFIEILGENDDDDGDDQED